MKLVCRYVFCALAALAVQCLTAAEVRSAAADSDACVENLEKRYGHMRDFKARFEQETRHEAISTVEKAGGTVYFKKGGMMLWDYTTPEPQQFILDGKNLWVYLPKDKQVMKNSYAALPSHIVAGLFEGSIDIRKTFTVSITHDSDNGRTAPVITLELVPRQYDPTVKRLTVWVDPGSWLIIKSRIEPEVGSSTVLQFFDHAVNRGMDDSIFRFVPPPGVEIFELPGR